MKRSITVLYAAILLLTGIPGLSGCGVTNGSAGTAAGKMNIVTTIFPEYDWAKNILGDQAQNANLTLLLDNGVDLHSYQPTTDDIVKISSADMFVYVGGESDDWVEDALSEAVNKDMVVVNLMDVLGDSVKEEELVEGMEHEHGDSNDAHKNSDDAHEDSETVHDDKYQDYGHDDDKSEESGTAYVEDKHEEVGATHDDDKLAESEAAHEEYDEHVWLSLKNAKLLSKAISDGLCKLDPDHKNVYETNLKTYENKLNDLDKQYEATVENSKTKTLLFGDRFPFRYLTDDYGLKYYAAFTGCSAESEASFETIIFLAGKVDELKLPVILTIEGNDHKIAETVSDNTSSRDQKILSLDSMQSTKKEDIENGVTYLSIMEKNLDVVKQAISS